MDIHNLLKEENVPEPKNIFITIKDGKKINPCGRNDKWTETVCKNKSNYFAKKNQEKNIVKKEYNLSNSSIGVIDFDEIDLPYEEVIIKYPFLKNCYYKTGNTKGFHFLVSNKLFKNINYNPTKIMTDYEGDFVGSIWWLNITDKLLGNEIYDISLTELYIIYDKYDFINGKDSKDSKDKPINNILNNNIHEIDDNVNIVIDNSVSEIDEVYEENDINYYEINEEQTYKDYNTNKLNILNNNKAEKPKLLKHFTELINNIKDVILQDYNILYKIIYSSYRNDDLFKDILYNRIKPLSEKRDNQEPYDKWFNRLYYYNKDFKYLYFDLEYIKDISSNSNREEYLKICKKYKINYLSIQDIEGLSELFVKNNKTNILIQRYEKEENVYIFNEKFNIWNLETKNLTLMKRMITKFIIDYFERVYNLSNKEFYRITESEQNNNIPLYNIKKKFLEETEFRQLLKAKSTRETPVLSQNINGIITSEYNDKMIKFDMKPYLLPFPDGFCIDFESENLDFTRIKKDDYILTTLDYKYEEPNTEDYNEYINMFNEIFIMNPDVGIDMMFILSTAMVGILISKFFILEGKGRNGKSVLMEILGCLLCDFNYTGTASMLYYPIDGTKPNPAISNIHNKRCTQLGEGNNNLPWEQNTIKICVGDDVINSRGCNENNNKVINTSTYIVPTNVRGVINGDLNEDCIGTKLKVLPFRTTFTDNQKLIKEINKMENDNIDKATTHLKNVFKCDEKYKHKKHIYKFCMLKQIREFLKKYNKVNNKLFTKNSWRYSKEVMEESKSYLDESDIIHIKLSKLYKPIKQIKNKNNEVQEQTKRISSKDIFENLIKTDQLIINNPEYPQYKNYTQQKFNKYLEKHDKYKNYYYKDLKADKIGGNIRYCVLVNLEEIPQKEDEDIDDTDINKNVKSKKTKTINYNNLYSNMEEAKYFLDSFKIR